MDLRPVMVVLLFLTSMFAGCIGESDQTEEEAEVDSIYPEPWDRTDRAYNDQDIYARVSDNGSHAIDAVSYTHLTLPTKA